MTLRFSLRRSILLTLADASWAMNTSQIARSTGHPNELSVFSAVRPLAKQGLIRVASRLPYQLPTGGVVSRPAYVITDQGRLWLRQQQLAKARAARKGTRQKHCAVALSEVWR